MENYLNEFKNPGANFRGKPFWAWNCRLDRNQLLRQLEYFKEMGMGGATIHCRTGLDTEYLGQEFCDDVRACVKRADELGMNIGLYDEDRWPSGFGGGMVTKDVRYRSRYLVFTPFKNEDRNIVKKLASIGSTAGEKAKGNGRLMARYDIELTDGYLSNYRRLNDNEEGTNVWYAYLEISEGTPWYNNQTYVDVFNPDAIKRFIEVTHEKYKETVGDFFGKNIPSIFTDEPQFVHKTCLKKADEKKDIILPYTDDFEQSYVKVYGESFLDHLPEVLWERADGSPSVTRYRYHDHIAERFASSYADTVGNWCRQNGISLTGHMMEEPTLRSQTKALGEAMRSYRSFDIPGIDMLCDRREYTTAKQAQSAAHQKGSNQVTSEIYGVTGWDFDFRGHKLQGDWQAALGVTERVHHLSWVSMEGESKRDYPASIFYQSPWYKKYGVIEDYFARLNTALRSGKPSVKVAVIHPIESYWIHFGPEEQTKIIRQKLDQQFELVTDWLLSGLIDFDFVSESLLKDLTEYENNEKGKFSAGCMNYDAVIIPGCETLRTQTLEKLGKFSRDGGKIIVMGKPPKYHEAVLMNDFKDYVSSYVNIGFDREELLNRLEDFRQIDLLEENMTRADGYVSQIREVGKDRIVFIAKAGKTVNPDIPYADRCSFKIKGEYSLYRYDAMSGEKTAVKSIVKNGWTWADMIIYDQDSILVYAAAKSDAKEQCAVIAKTVDTSMYKALKGKFEYCTEESNVLLLDQAEFSLDGESFEALEEVLRIDNILRERLGYPKKMESLAQPWTEKSFDGEKHRLMLRYKIESELEVKGCMLALENASETKVYLNGELMDSSLTGYYVDECINTVEIGPIKKGVNELILEIPYDRKSNLEWCYLLGEFGVEVYGNQSIITSKPEKIGFSDISRQKLPFYGGNIKYYIEAETEEGEYTLRINKFRAPLIEVAVDGAYKDRIFIAPYTARLGHLKSGMHRFEITVYGNRFNTFGSLHLCNEKDTWLGPNAWRSEGYAYSYEYQLKAAGILSAPVLYRHSGVLKDS